MRRILGPILLLMGIVLACWIGYNLFIQRLPEAQHLDPLPAVIFAAALLYVGYRWTKGEIAK